MMRKHALALIGAVLLAASLVVVGYSPAFTAGLGMTILTVSPSSLTRLSHGLIGIALLVEAWAIWQHAKRDTHASAWRAVCGMFIVAAGLGLTAVAMDAAPKNHHSQPLTA